MEGDHFYGWNKRSLNWTKNAEEEIEELKVAVPALPSVPETQKEPLDFLSRSWSHSDTEISKALAQKNVQKQFIVNNNNPTFVPGTVTAPQMTENITNVVNARKTRTIRRWFQNKEMKNCKEKKKNKARVENARMHSAVSVAGVAAALASVAATENGTESGTKMSMCLASATELLASYCIEMAESAGAPHDLVASVVESSVDIRSSSDLLTLAAAAATALRGEATLKARAYKEGKKIAAIRPYYKYMADSEERDPPCLGDLLQHTYKGVFRWKHVSIYINRKSQVTIKLKSKNIGGAFSKKNKCVVYGICDENTAWPYRKERENVEAYFGVKTAKGLLEFKCKNKIHKQRWVDGIQNLLCRTISIQEAQQSLSFLNIK